MGTKRLYQKVADKILELVDSGVFPVGSRLPGERDLAEQFGVSRVAVREAEIFLQAKGLIDIKVGSGAYVKATQDAQETVLPEVGAFELTEARALFEAESAALAAPIITDETLDELENYIEIMSGNIKSKMSPDEADAAFHHAIAKATNNSVIVYIIENLWNMRTDSEFLQQMCNRVCDLDTSHREKEHRAVLDALKNRDSSAARRAMRAHFTRMIEELLEASEEKAYRQVEIEAAENRSRFTLAKRLVP